MADYQLQGAWYFVTICCHGKRPLMRSAKVRDCVESVLVAECRSSRVEVAAYSILPNHLHLVCSAGVDNLVGFIRRFKSKTTRQIRRNLASDFQWQKSFFDHKIRSDESLQEKCRYIFANPVRLGLCENWESYRWNGQILSNQ